MYLPLLLTIALIHFTAVAGTMDPELVLVVSSRSPVNQMSITDARKLFLGLPIRINSQPVKPVRNVSDQLVTETFLQKVMFMAAEDYERQINARVSRAGGGRPPTYDSLPELVDALQRDPLAVSYMPRADVRATAGLKIVGAP